VAKVSATKKRLARNTRRRKRSTDLRTDRFIRVCARYLRYSGWTMVVGGPVTIEKRGPDKWKYTLAIDFLGGVR